MLPVISLECGCNREGGEMNSSLKIVCQNISCVSRTEWPRGVGEMNKTYRRLLTPYRQFVVDVTMYFDSLEVSGVSVQVSGFSTSVS